LTIFLDVIQTTVAVFLLLISVHAYMLCILCVVVAIAQMVLYFSNGY